MKKIDYKEFRLRVKEVAKARKIFIKSGITNNITEAFQLYQEVLADEKMEVIVRKSQMPFENIERPRCDECDSELKLSTWPIRIDGETYPTTWKCENCGMEYYTEKTAEEWYMELKNEDKRENDQDKE